jgi:hypothetical protein
VLFKGPFLSCKLEKAGAKFYNEWNVKWDGSGGNGQLIVNLELAQKKEGKGMGLNLLELAILPTLMIDKIEGRMRCNLLGK